MTRQLNRMLGALAAASAFVVGCARGPTSPTVVDVNTSDGVMLKATVFAAGKPGPAVLMLPQCDEQRKVWDSLGVKLMRNGITAVSVDYRGYGESGGTPHDKIALGDLARQMADQWPSDIDSAYALLLRQPGVQATNIGIAGGSCGVIHTLLLARRKHDITALALLAGPADHDGRALIAADNAPPVFLGAAADDPYDNFVEIQGWYGALSRNKMTRVMEYPDGGHAAMVFNKHPAFADTIAQWFSAVLNHKPELLPATNGRIMNAGVVATLRELDQPNGPAHVTQQLALARKTNPHAQLFPQYYVNQLGYDHMLAKDFPGAIEIMTLNTVAYPDSPNAQDSLGDVYLASGDTLNTLRTAQRTLILLKTDTVDTTKRKQDIQASAEGKIRALSSR